MHEEADAGFAVVEDLVAALPPPTESKDALVAAAFKNRSEVRALRILSEVHATSADVHAADAFPKLAIGGSAEYSKPNPRAVGDTGWSESWAAFASLSWSPNDLASGSSRAAQARADLVRTQADLRAIEDALRLEVTRTYEAQKAARAAMEAALTGIAAAEESYRVRREQFRAGSAVATDVIDAEAELRRARLDLVNAAIDTRIAQARLERAVER
jgi:outer membrane protein TolC